MKELKLQDYLHFYLGAPCYKKNSTITNKHPEILTTRLYDWCKSSGCRTVKLVLRPLSDMTEIEANDNELVDVQKGLLSFGERLQMYMTATQFAKCLKMRFDLFGLIPAGLAIDSTTITN